MKRGYYWFYDANSDETTHYGKWEVVYVVDDSRVYRMGDGAWNVPQLNMTGEFGDRIDLPEKYET